MKNISVVPISITAFFHVCISPKGRSLKNITTLLVISACLLWHTVSHCVLYFIPREMLNVDIWVYMWLLMEKNEVAITVM